MCFSYDLALALKTSFTGKDLLFTRLRVGNVDNAMGGKGFNLTGLDYPSNSNNDVRVGRLYYRFPVGSDFTVVVGPRLRNTENLGYKPSAYTSGGHPQLDLFSGSLGVPGVWSKTLVLASERFIRIKPVLRRVRLISQSRQTMWLKREISVTQILVVS